MSVMRRALPAISTRSAAGMGAQVLDDLLADREHRRQQQRARPAPPPRARPSAASDVLLGLRPEARDGAQALLPRPPRAAPRASRCRARRGSCARSSAPRPGMRVNRTSSPGNFARSFTAAGMSPVSSSARIFSSSVFPTLRQLGRAALARELRHRHRRVADRLGGLAVGDHPVDRRRRPARRGRPARPWRRRSRRSSCRHVDA